MTRGALGIFNGLYSMVIDVADAQEYVRIFEGICREQRVKNYYIQCHKVRERERKHDQHLDNVAPADFHLRTQFNNCGSRCKILENSLLNH